MSDPCSCGKYEHFTGTCKGGAHASQFFEVDLPPVIERKIQLVDAVLPDTEKVGVPLGSLPAPAFNIVVLQCCASVLREKRRSFATRMHVVCI